MGLLLTRHVDEDRIHVRSGVRCAVLDEHLHAALAEPFADQLALQTITLNHQYAPHRLAST